MKFPRRENLQSVPLRISLLRKTPEALFGRTLIFFGFALIRKSSGLVRPGIADWACSC
jgi:hypothetical protein